MKKLTHREQRTLRQAARFMQWQYDDDMASGNCGWSNGLRRTMERLQDLAARTH